MAIDVTVSGLNTVVDVEFAESPSDIDPETYIALRGEKGDKGDTGAAGQDGYTPIKGVDYFDGQDGADGYTPIKGVDYFDGQDGQDGADGFSPIATVSKVGDTATISITDVNGTTTATVTDGTDGQDGADGQDGYTPIKGVDYFDGVDGKDGKDGQDGTDGVDGFSPIATVTKAGDTATISITDENGTTTATVSDGADGQDGRDGTDGQDGTDGVDGVGIASITKTASVGLVDTYTITYTDGTTTTYEVTNGQNGSGSVADVWVDGVSVLDDDTAKIDLTGKSDVGHTHTTSAITDFPSLATVATSGSYNDLLNKPMIPTVNDATLTIQKNGTNVQTFTANASSNVTANITVPTDTGDLTNGAGFITDYTETDPVFSASAASGISSSDIDNWDGKSDFSGDYDDLSNKPTIPSDTGDLTNGAGFLDASGILNLFYPIGSYYETSDTSFDPNITWGGTWQLEAEGQVHISAGTNYSVSGALTDTTDGGSPDAIVPYHNHTDDIAVSVTSSGTCTTSATSKTLTGAWYCVNLNTVTADGIMSRSGYSSSAYTGFSSNNRAGSKVSIDATHTHTIPNHTHTTSKSGGVGYAGTDGNTTNANMQPYIIVNRWHRTA